MMELLNEATRRNPYPFYERIRQSCPVLYVPQGDLWMIFDYAGVKRALGDHESFSSSMFTASRRNPAWFFFFDPPHHTRMRALVSRALTPRVIDALEPRIRELSRQLLDRMIARGEMDLATDFSIPLPMLVIAELLGIPGEDRARFRQWSDEILKLSYTLSDGEEAQRASEGFTTVTVEMDAYLARLLAQRRAAPADDLLTHLLEAEVDGERLTHEGILGFFQLLLVAGTETTTNLINNAILCFIEHPDQLARLRADPNLLPAAIEEVLRYRTPVQWTFRATRRDVELHGCVIPQGTLVLPVIGSANRDPAHFREPDRFDICREPNPHLAFGHGIHGCLGAALSRLEGRIALADLLRRTSAFGLASSEPWEPRKALHVHGPARLPIRFVPSAAP